VFCSVLCWARTLGPAARVLFTCGTAHLHRLSRRATQSQHHRNPHIQLQRTMAPRGALTNISFTVDSASEDEMTYDELNALPTPESNTENKAPARKSRGKAAQSKATAPATKAPAKGKPVARRVSGGSVLSVKKGTAAVAKKAPAKAGRKALAERNDINGSDTEEVDDFDEDHVAAPVKTAKRGRPAKTPKAQDDSIVEVPAPAKKGRKPAAAKESVPKKEAKATARAKTTKRAPDTDHEAKTIPETQPEPELDPMDIEESIEIEEVLESIPPPPRPSARRVQAEPSRARQTSAGTRRAGSASDSERDPVLRRKLGDLTRKFESLTARYEILKEAATSTKESNFEQLKKRTEVTAKGTPTTNLTDLCRTNPLCRSRRSHQSPQTTNLRPAIPHLRPRIAEKGTHCHVQRQCTPRIRKQEAQRLAHCRTKRNQESFLQARCSPVLRAARNQERARQRSQVANKWRCSTRYC
jgi:hypothetical protein